MSQISIRALLIRKISEFQAGLERLYIDPKLLQLDVNEHTDFPKLVTIVDVLFPCIDDIQHDLLGLLEMKGIVMSMEQIDGLCELIKTNKLFIEKIRKYLA